MTLSDKQKIELFRKFFHGRTDIYARRWEKDGKSGYSPAYEFDWNEFMSHKRLGGSFKDFKNKHLSPLTELVVRKHLIGQDVIGIYPILPDNSSYFLAADFDGETWKKEADAFIEICTKAGLTVYLERSRSGCGGHVWIFFSEPYPCYRSRQIGFELIRRTFNASEFEKDVGFDRFFPNQDTLSQGGFGNLIALPFQGKSVAEGNTLFLDPLTEKPVVDQWGFLEHTKRYSKEEMNAVHRRLFEKNENALAQTTTTRNVIALSIGNQIAIDRSQITQELKNFLKEELNFINTEYLTKRSLGKSVYRVPKYFKLIEESENAVSLPRGFLNKLTPFLEEHSIHYSVRHEHTVLDEILFDNSIVLTPNQARAVGSAVGHDQGVIVAPSGSGKTIIGLEIIARRKLPALILVHRKQILDQWIERIQTFLGIPKSQIGQYSGSKKKIGKQITVGLLQSLARNTNLSELRNNFGTVIVDECHHIPASTFRQVIIQFNPAYLYGLTATPKRKHNDEKLIYVFIGDIISRVETTDFKPESVVIAQPPEVIVRPTGISLPFKFKTDLFQLLSKVICFDTGRNRLIVEDIVEQVTNHHKVLVLSERKEHLDVINLYLKGQCETIVVSGDDSARARKSKIGQIEGGHYQAILSTGQFFGEGIDIRGMSCLILAFPFSFEGKLMQYIGRLRDSGSQKLIIDYRDKDIPFLERQFKQRERYYKKHCKILNKR
jgi:superfamily II DNA or RNA helicase